MRIDRSDLDGCWPWTGPRQRNRKGEYGYGLFCTSWAYDGVEKTIRAHRWGYEHLIGTIPPGLWVLHHCDNPPCQNPSHWFLGTHADNVADKVAKGRQWSKLTPSDVRAIRAMRQSTSLTKTEIAAVFEVDARTVRAVLTGEWWSHVV